MPALSSPAAAFASPQPAQSQKKIDEVLSRLQQMAVESHAHAHAHAAVALPPSDGDSVSSRSSHSHSTSLSTTATTTTASSHTYTPPTGSPTSAHLHSHPATTRTLHICLPPQTSLPALLHSLQIAPPSAVYALRNATEGHEREVWCAWASAEAARDARERLASYPSVRVQESREGDLDTGRKMRRLDVSEKPMMHSNPAFAPLTPLTMSMSMSAFPLSPPASSHSTPTSASAAVNPSNLASLSRLGLTSRQPFPPSMFPSFQNQNQSQSQPTSPLDNMHQQQLLYTPGPILPPLTGRDPLSMGQNWQGDMGNAPPPPKVVSFRQGDWICASPACCYHNFQRNELCIACGWPRPVPGPGPSRPQQQQQQPQLYANSPAYQQHPPPPPPPSTGAPYMRPAIPRLAPPAPLYLPLGGGGGGGGPGAPASARSPSILTPSGRAFASTGRTRNVSGDEGNPVIMFWPDNEALPEMGQIRPPLAGVAQPPILNTGNKGPIEHQPGDWYCHKCEYLNWRRRKVCQTCFPFAEGNEDGISPTLQAERIGVLTALLVAAKQARDAGVHLDIGGVLGMPHGQGPASAPAAGAEYGFHPILRGPIGAGYGGNGMNGMNGNGNGNVNYGEPLRQRSFSSDSFALNPLREPFRLVQPNNNNNNNNKNNNPSMPASLPPAPFSQPSSLADDLSRLRLRTPPQPTPFPFSTPPAQPTTTPPAQPTSAFSTPMSYPSHHAKPTPTSSVINTNSNTNSNNNNTKTPSPLDPPKPAAARNIWCSEGEDGAWPDFFAARKEKVADREGGAVVPTPTHPRLTGIGMGMRGM